MPIAIVTLNMSSNKIQPSCKRVCEEMITGYKPTRYIHRTDIEIGGHAITSNQCIDECGIDVKRLPKTVRLGEDGTTYNIPNMARLTGLPDIFSADDALAELIVNERVEREVGDETRYLGSSVYYRALAREVARAESDIQKLGANAVLETFPESRRIALKNQAARFMEDARALVQSSKK